MDREHGGAGDVDQYPDRLRLRAPCGHAVPSAPFMRFAPVLLRRRCRSCRCYWTVLITPGKSIDRKFSEQSIAMVHKVEWQEVPW